MDRRYKNYRNNNYYNQGGYYDNRGYGRRNNYNNYRNNNYYEYEVEVPSEPQNNNNNNNNKINNNPQSNNNNKIFTKEGIEIEYVENKNKNKKNKNRRGNNYNNNRNQKEVEIEYAPEEIYNEMKGKGHGKLIEKEITTNQVFKDDLLNDEHYENINQNDLHELNNDNYDDENYDDDYYESTDYYNENYYNDNSESGSTSTSNTNKNYQNKKYKNPLTFTDESGFTQLVDSQIKAQTKNNYNNNINDNFLNILMIAEKPSIAKMISEVLSNGKYKNLKAGKGKCLISFDGYFQGIKSKFTVSAVAGHVYTSDFMREHNKWENIDESELYNVPIVKLEANRKMYMPNFIQKISSGKDILCLWLDCDSEGENICYEVIYNALPYMNKKSYQQIYRAKFSSLTKKDLKYAFDNLYDPPNKNESMSVDCRQVIDLKIGVSFTRFLTSTILPALEEVNNSTNILSYGPCQTPTLWFCVERMKEINNFKPKQYYRIYVEIEVNHIRHKISYEKKLYAKKEAEDIISKLNKSKTAFVRNITINHNSKNSPTGLNTVNLLRGASSFLKISPHDTMVIAEKLYTMGYMTYPRTETTKYANSFDFVGSLKNFENHEIFGEKVKKLLVNFEKPKPKGIDMGDHPPITPSKVANPKDLNGQYWKLYEFICNHFFASLSPSIEYDELNYTIDIGGEIFEENSSKIINDGFLLFQEYKRKNYIRDFPILEKNKDYNISNINYTSGWTEAPDYLTESDLISEMEKNRIGTDASMPVHIENICQRGYVKVDEKRRLIPTQLGKALIDALGEVDSEIIHPENRAKIEQFVNDVAHGKKKYDETLKYALDLYQKKFFLVRIQHDKILNIFRKYFNVNTGNLGFALKNVKERNEKFKRENFHTKKENEINTDLNTCDECKKGKMYIEYDRFDKYCIFCTNCKRRTKVIRDAVKIEVNKNKKCEKCGSYFIDVEVENPFLNGDKTYCGCLICDPKLN